MYKFAKIRCPLIIFSARGLLVPSQITLFSINMFPIRGQRDLTGGNIRSILEANRK